MATSPVYTDFADDFQSLSSTPAQAKPGAYSGLLDRIITTGSSANLESNLTAYLISLLGTENPIQGVSTSTDPPSITAARSLLSTFVQKLSTLSPLSTRIAIAQAAIALLHPRVVSFHDQDTSLKFLLADAHAAEEDFLASAKALQSITLDGASRAVPDADKARIWVRIARCYLEEDDATTAGQYINRAKNVMHNVKDPELALQFKLSSARILDSQRHFLDASAAYQAVSFEPLVDDEDRAHALAAAMTCAVLAPAGPLRARQLARLYKDERAPQADQFAILEKMFLDRVLAPEEVAAFASKLQPHQLARTADGSTVLDRAVLEHNLLGASRLYRNIGFVELGTLLGVDGERAEQYAAQMIEQGRLAGYIDQVEERIFFKGEGSGERLGAGAGAQANGTAASELARWDAGVQSLTEEVERVTTMIQTEFPVRTAPSSSSSSCGLFRD